MIVEQDYNFLRNLPWFNTFAMNPRAELMTADAYSKIDCFVFPIISTIIIQRYFWSGTLGATWFARVALSLCDASYLKSWDLSVLVENPRHCKSLWIWLRSPCKSSSDLREGHHQSKFVTTVGTVYQLATIFLLFLLWKPFTLDLKSTSKGKSC